ncbi:MAG: hypothetical protein GTN72_11870 [Candidatus Latescibacteria bacterium]|nr:hypothetical protein [Candidatus Latescibacterota bacterium]
MKKETRRVCCGLERMERGRQSCVERRVFLPACDEELHGNDENGTGAATADLAYESNHEHSRLG